MKRLNKTGLLALAYSAMLASSAFAFDSGSTGEDGALSPTEDVVIPLPPDGILNYTTINIPEGITVRFGRNGANTPAYLLVQGDATISGTIDISGRDGRSLDSLPPGGFAGGPPRSVGARGGNGLGPGGGSGGCNNAGDGADYAINGGTKCESADRSYGNNALQPLIGGSGGGAGFVHSQTEGRVFGTAGGSGAGALLIAVSGSLDISGSILAIGGDGESLDETFQERFSISAGGAGSGGAVRLISTEYQGTGTIDVSGGKGGLAFGDFAEIRSGGDGSYGRVSIEYETSLSRPNVIPTDFVAKAPQPIFLDNLPTVRIASINNQDVPANPNGEGDVILPDNASNNITLNIEATNVPEGTTVKLFINRPDINITTAITDGLTLDGAVLKVSDQISLREGNTRIIASLGFSVSSLQARTLSRFTNGETVEKVELASAMGGQSRLRLTTVSGREYVVDPTAR